MSIAIFITKSGIIISDAGIAARNLLSRLQSSIDSGEATAAILSRADDGAAIIETYGDARNVADATEAALSNNTEAITREAAVVALGAVAAFIPAAAPVWAAVALGIGLGVVYDEALKSAGEWSRNNDWSKLFDYIDSLKGRLINIPADESNEPLFETSEIDPTASSQFSNAQHWVAPVRRDPLTFDLDGDGLETIGIDPTNPILFDHDGDGIKTASGWISADDAFLVLDRNSNGTIDNGTELFGNSTPLGAGGTAVDGFEALNQEDTRTYLKIA